MSYYLMQGRGIYSPGARIDYAKSKLENTKPMFCISPLEAIGTAHVTSRTGPISVIYLTLKKGGSSLSVV